MNEPSDYHDMLSFTEFTEEPPLEEATSSMLL